ELATDVGLVVLVEVDVAAPHDVKTHVLKLLAGLADLIGRRLQRQVVGLDVHVFQAQALDHLDRFGAQKLSQRIGRYAELKAAVVARRGGAEVKAGKCEQRAGGRPPVKMPWRLKTYVDCVAVPRVMPVR